MNVFLREVSDAYKNEEIILVMDGAGWHKSKELKIPENIEIIILPPYSPELNPVERFWQHIKRYTIRNKIYRTLTEVKNAVAKFLNSISADIIKSICTADYIW